MHILIILVIQLLHFQVSERKLKLYKNSKTVTSRVITCIIMANKILNNAQSAITGHQPLTRGLSFHLLIDHQSRTHGLFFRQLTNNLPIDCLSISQLTTDVPPSKCLGLVYQISFYWLTTYQSPTLLPPTYQQFKWLFSTIEYLYHK